MLICTSQGSFFSSNFFFLFDSGNDSDNCHRQPLRFQDEKDSLIALLIGDSDKWVKSRLDGLLRTLQHLMPETMEPQDSTGENFKFKTIHCDVYNRYAERVSLLFRTSFHN